MAPVVLETHVVTIARTSWTDAVLARVALLIVAISIFDWFAACNRAKLTQSFFVNLLTSPPVFNKTARANVRAEKNFPTGSSTET
jgi:hypothetical protein